MSTLIIAFFLIISSTNLSARTFHVLLAADTDDLTEEGIGIPAEKSLRDYAQTFSYLSSISNSRLRMKKLTSIKSNYCYSAVSRWIKREKVAPDDIVVFVYNGHGSRIKKTRTILPTTHFQYDDQIDFADLAKDLISKKAALTLVLLDCCNSFSDRNMKKEPYIEYDESKASFVFGGYNDNLVRAGCEELFSKPFGALLATSALPGQAAFYRVSTKGGRPTGRMGGIFSSIFLKNLFQEIQTPSPRWRRIFRRTQAETEEDTKQCYTVFHTPQYRMLLHKHRKKPSYYLAEFVKKCAYHSKTLLTKTPNPLSINTHSCTCFLGLSIDEFCDKDA